MVVAITDGEPNRDMFTSQSWKDDVQFLQTVAREYQVYMAIHKISIPKPYESKLYLMPFPIYRELKFELDSVIEFINDDVSLEYRHNPEKRAEDVSLARLPYFNSLISLAADGKITAEDASAYICQATAARPITRIKHGFLADLRANPDMSPADLSDLISKLSRVHNLHMMRVFGDETQLALELKLFGVEAVIGHLESLSWDRSAVHELSRIQVACDSLTRSERDKAIAL